MTQLSYNSSSTALFTDRYELTMLDAALRSGQAHQTAVFEVFTRSLPTGRGYGVVAGTARAMEAIENFRFGDGELRWLADNKIVSPEALEYLEAFSFDGDIWGFAEGELFGANSPVLTVEASFGQAVLLETVLLSIFNYDSAVASAVARMVDAANGRSVIDGGARRAHESAATSAARAAFISGAMATSNLEAGRTYGIPTIGTIGHAFVLAHESEAAAFDAQHSLLGSDTTYLVDTYDISQGIAQAVATAGASLGGIRIDSGDLSVESQNARQQLDDLGAREARIIVSGDLDEWSIANLATAPIDGYLVGTNLITGSGHPTASFVYKLVAIESQGQMKAVAKNSFGKSTIGGRKAVFRPTTDDGQPSRNDTALIVPTGSPLDQPPEGRSDLRPLQQRLVVGGNIAPLPTLEACVAFCTQSRNEMSVDLRKLDASRSLTTELVN